MYLSDVTKFGKKNGKNIESNCTYEGRKEGERPEGETTESNERARSDRVHKTLLAKINSKAEIMKKIGSKNWKWNEQRQRSISNEKHDVGQDQTNSFSPYVKIEL